jgi:preprotein translocase subunit SecE
MANPLTNYLKQAMEELKKVVWPSKQETTQHTLIVIGLSLAVAIFLGAIDYLLNLGLQNILLRR